MTSNVLFQLLLCMVATSEKIRCVSCNSFNDDERWCSSSEEVAKRVKDADSDADHFVECDSDDAPKDVGNVVAHCRKLEQVIDSVSTEHRVIRECAYSGKVVDGQRRTGNKGIKIFTWQCKNEDYCNAAPSQYASALVVAVAMVVAAVRL